MPDENPVLVVDADEETRDHLRTILGDAGYSTRLTKSIDEALAVLETVRPCLVLLEPHHAAGGDFRLLHEMKWDERLRGVPVIVLTSLQGSGDVTHAFEAGADDFVRKPIGGAELLARIRAHLRLRGYVDELGHKEQDAMVMLELTQALTSSQDFQEILFTVVSRIAQAINVERVSIVLVPEREQRDVGYVVVTSDDEELTNLRIDLTKYPEIQRVLNTGESLTIEDASTHPLLEAVRENVKGNRVGSMTLLPIRWQDQVLGVLFLRAGAHRPLLTDRDVGFCRVVANATAIALRNVRALQSLRDETKQISDARVEAEQRLESFKQYADLFASLADGICVVDASGHVNYANPRACAILGTDSETLAGQRFREIVQEEDHDRAKTIWAGFSDGSFPTDVDLRLTRPDESTFTANVSFSSLLHREDSVLFTFRDVTASRELEAELVRTKEFLESLINASVDGIVAADMRGTIILFNEGARRIYGFSPDEVVGKKNVRDLYPEGGARTVMDILRSPQHGGEGRLENMKLEALNAAGEAVPISLSAAMIYQQDKPIATFGIFTDLRDRLRVEERLAQAQQQLAVSEKQALIAELAGTAAHELNQPLTSVRGYAELLTRKLDDTSDEHHAAGVIMSESERMAEIVRKIGKITKYETKSYVGGQRILDLDRATDSERPSSPPRRTSSPPVEK